MARTIIGGDALMLFLNGKSVAQATSHTLTQTTTMQDTASKDYGKFGSKNPQKIEWELQSENLFTTYGFNQIQQAQLTMQPLVAYFGFAKNNESLEGLPAGATEFDFDDTKLFSYGDVYISSLNVTAASGDNATFSCTMTGSGKIHTGGTV